MFHVKHFLSQWLMNKWLGLANVWPMSGRFLADLWQFLPFWEVFVPYRYGKP